MKAAVAKTRRAPKCPACRGTKKITVRVTQHGKSGETSFPMTCPTCAVRPKNESRFADIRIVEQGSIEGSEWSANGRTNFRASLPMFLIHETWGEVDYDDLADGFGPGLGTMGDWSGIRDSSDEAKSAMLERALNHLFGKERSQ